MKKGQKALLIIGIILILLSTFFIIVGAIEPYQAVDGVNPWRKEELTQISAHRGGDLLNPENTKKAFDYVIDETTYTDLVEFDVRVTKDNKLAIIHDDTINRTGISGEADKVYINDSYLNDLKSYNLGVNFKDQEGNLLYADIAGDKLAENGLEILELGEFFATYSSSRKDFKILLEIKDTGELGKTAVDLAEAVIANYSEWDERVMIISFSTDVISYVLENYPNRYVAGMGYNMVPFLIGSILGVDSLINVKYQSIQSSVITKAGPIELDCATEAFVTSAHRRNQMVAYWTINDEASMRKLIDLGADAITTDNPYLLAQVLGKIA